MNAKQELAGRVQMLVQDEIQPDMQRILSVLEDYTIGYNSGIKEHDFQRQIQHFLYDKKSDGVADSSLSNYKMYLNLFCNYSGKATADITTRNAYPHILRHTLATDLLNTGVDITIIQQILGHSSVGTTQIYAEMSHENVQREHRKCVA